MEKKLVIVESPTKARTLSAILGEDYTITSSYGHIRDLPRKSLGIEVEKDFAPTWEVPEGKKKAVTALKKEAKGAKEVYLSTDPDREGEAIAWNLRETLIDADKKSDADLHRFRRVVFHEITPEAVREAFSHPGQVNEALVTSQHTRRILDRLVGYKLSPLLWKKVARGLSAGRVQSVAVRLIVEREKEREAFKPQEYWEISARLQVTGNRLQVREFEAKLISKDGEKIEIKSESETNQIVSDLEKAGYRVESIKVSQRQRHPYPPFTTSTLTQSSFNIFGFTTKRTMRAAQNLFEQGLITYHRTDSVNLAEKALHQIREYVQEQIGPEYLSPEPIRYKTKSKLAQEAHEAIRPTDPFRKVAEDGSRIGEDEEKLYDLILRQTLACQMKPAVYEETDVEIFASSHTSNQLPVTSYLLRASGSKLLFAGWEKVWGRDHEVRDKGEGISDKELPKLQEGEELELIELVPSQHFTQPPPRYTEATLVKTLEENGIGRPSTYSPIISTIQDRGYVVKEGRGLKPEDIGVLVNDLLVEHFPDVVDIGFTAKMEDELDLIAKGEEDYLEVLKDFWGPFSKTLAQKEKELNKREVITLEEIGENCPESGHPLVIKIGRFGKFISCSGYPECKYRRAFLETIGMKCPKCQTGDVIIKRTRRRKIFYGCSRYPECDFASWTDPRKQEKG